MTNINENPWAVHYLEEFLYYCCPECEVKDQSKALFLQHALDKHPKAKGCIPGFSVKEEPIEDIEDNQEVKGENDELINGISGKH